MTVMRELKGLLEELDRIEGGMSPVPIEFLQAKATALVAVSIGNLSDMLLKEIADLDVTTSRLVEALVVLDATIERERD